MSNMNTRIRKAALAVFGILFAIDASAEVPPTTVEGTILTMPVVIVFDEAYSLQFEIVPSGADIDIVLVGFQQLVDVDTAGAPSFFGGLLYLPSLILDDVSYWGEFSLVNDNPVTFRLTGVDANDPGESGVEGKWRVIETENAEDCGEGTYTLQYDVEVTQDGNLVTVVDPQGTWEATLMGTSLQWDASYPEEGGTSNDTVMVEFASSLDVATGSSTWTWTGPGGSCSGSSTFTAILLHN